MTSTLSDELATLTAVLSEVLTVADHKALRRIRRDLDAIRSRCTPGTRNHRSVQQLIILVSMLETK